jgi:uncharacterized protein YecE (DUF72 family)
MGSNKIKVGTCGFPASKEKLFSEVDVIEVQQTFYHPPEIETLKKWRDLGEGKVEFTLKAWQLITHLPSSPTYKRIKGELKEKIPKISDELGFFKNTKEVFRAYERILECCEALGATAIIFQSPSSFKPVDENIRNLREFFKKVFRPEKVLFVWEPRGKWDKTLLKELSRDCKILIGGDPLGGGYLMGNVLYLRLHGIGGYRYKFTEDDFRNISKIIGNKNAYVMFNNISMFEDAVRFKKFLKKGGKNG